MVVAYYHKAITIDPTNGKPIQFVCACTGCEAAKLNICKGHSNTEVINTSKLCELLV